MKFTIVQELSTAEAWEQYKEAMDNLAMNVQDDPGDSAEEFSGTHQEIIDNFVAIDHITFATIKGSNYRGLAFFEDPQKTRGQFYDDGWQPIE